MIVLQVSRQGSVIRSFRLTGHSGYAESGSDIICAAVSALVYNAVNSCEEFLGVTLQVKDTEDTFLCDVQHDGGPQNDSVQLLLRSMVFGIEQIAAEYSSHVVVKYLS